MKSKVLALLIPALPCPALPCSAQVLHMQPKFIIKTATN
ncbi:hypothetical protein B230_2101 [Escherichia coli 14A]|nr:hypothetical protein B230_2101 [Escherichia coli 14A]